jgi:hypothetical protein
LDFSLDSALAELLEIFAGTACEISLAPQCISRMSLLARERSFYALIKQFRFARGRRSYYPLCHDGDIVFPTPKEKPD